MITGKMLADITIQSADSEYVMKCRQWLATMESRILSSARAGCFSLRCDIPEFMAGKPDCYVNGILIRQCADTVGYWLSVEWHPWALAMR